jgi:hypothetical protein
MILKAQTMRHRTIIADDSPSRNKPAGLSDRKSMGAMS